MAARLIARALAPAATAVLLGAGGALAAQVSTSSHCETHGGGKGCSTVVTATYTAAPGEANDLTVTRESGAFVFSDVVPVEPGTGCESRSVTAVACPARRGVVKLGDGADSGTVRPYVPEPGSFYVSLQIDGGDGPDRLTTAAVDSSATGGEGDDELAGQSLQGGPGADTLTGTERHDYLDGGAGSDELRAAGDDDTLVGDGSPYPQAAEPARDLLDGGAGSDAVSYSAHAVPVEVRLLDGVGGAEGEDDRLIDVEHAYGGRAADHLVGDDGANALYGYNGYDPAGIDHDVVLGLGGDDSLNGGPGNDLVDGGPGDDTVRGGAFHDALEGGPGDDVLEGDDGTDRFAAGDGDDLIYVADVQAGPEEVVCGGGADRALLPIVALLEPDCELVVVGTGPGPRIPAYPAAGAASRLVFKFACPLARQCTGRLRLRLAGQPREFFADRRWSTRTGRVRLAVGVPRAIRARPGARLPLVARLEMKQGRKPEYDPRYAGIWSFDLRRVPGFGR